jgi:hypothetical protein
LRQALAVSVWHTTIKYHSIDASVFVIDIFVSRLQGRRSENDEAVIMHQLFLQHIPDKQAWLPSPTNVRVVGLRQKGDYG